MKIPAATILNGDVVTIPTTITGTVTHKTHRTPSDTITLHVATPQGDVQYTIPALSEVEVAQITITETP